MSDRHTAGKCLNNISPFFDVSITFEIVMYIVCESHIWLIAINSGRDVFSSYTWWPRALNTHTRGRQVKKRKKNQLCVSRPFQSSVHQRQWLLFLINRAHSNDYTLCVMRWWCVCSAHSILHYASHNFSLSRKESKGFFCCCYYILL